MGKKMGKVKNMIYMKIYNIKENIQMVKSKDMGKNIVTIMMKKMKNLV